MDNSEKFLDGIELNYQGFFDSENLEHLKKGKLKNIGKKIGDAVKKVANKAANVAKTVSKTTVGKIAKTAAVLPLIAPLLPMKKAMEKMLDKKGVKYNKKKFVQTVEAFANNFLPKKNLESLEAYNKPIENIEPATLTVIVKAIFALFKNIKDKVAQNKASKEEKDVALALDSGAESVAESSDEDLSFSLGVDDVELESEIESPKPTGKTKRKDKESEGSNQTVMLFALVVLVFIISKNN